jgi:DNA-binding CsgD family transcriptional regulator
MLESLGLSAQAEGVYRALLAHPGLGVTDLAHFLSITEADLRETLDLLVDLALLTPTWRSDRTLRLVSPQVALGTLLAQAEAEIAVRQRQIEATRAAIVAMAAEHDESRDRFDSVRHPDLDSVRARLEELAHTAAVECLSLTPGGAMMPDTMSAGEPLNERALKRGVSICNVYQESFRNDPATLAFARAMGKLGSQSRTTPVVPIKLVIVDKAVALLPISPNDARQGALEVRSSGMLAALTMLFEKVWEQATPIGEAPRTFSDGLEPTEKELIRLLGDGHTDESAGRRLGVSVRTIRRQMSELTQRLNAASRFQAGAEAVRRGWL